jgi:hypothetical protein
MHLDVWLLTPMRKESESKRTDEVVGVCLLRKARRERSGPEKCQRNASTQQPTLKAVKSAGKR